MRSSLNVLPAAGGCVPAGGWQARSLLAGYMPGRRARRSGLGSTSPRLRIALCALLLLLAAPVPGALAAQAHPAPPPPHSRPDQRPGYLGVSLLDLDADTAARLHLKDTHGALVVTIDRDAPAAAAGLRARDVIVELSGQRIDNVDALRRKLHETPSGSTVILRFSRDGAEQAVSVQLGDQAEIAERAWEQHFSSADLAGSGPPVAPAAPGPDSPSSFVAPHGHGSGGPGSSFLGRFSINALYTGAELDPLSTQLAEYFGVHDGAGLLVRTVNENSPASAAGLKAGDVILRVNNQLVVSREDWTKQLHANRGRSMQLSVMRNRHEQTMAMTAGTAKKR